MTPLATRYLIPVELFAYAHVVVLAAFGGLGDGLMHEILDHEHEALIWLLVLGVVGFLGFAVALTEWLCGQGWDSETLRLWLGLRKWSALLGMVVCSYAIYTILEVPQGWRVASVPWMGGINMTFLGWSWWINYRTQTLLDPSLSTHTLETTLASRRRPIW